MLSLGACTTLINDKSDGPGVQGTVVDVVKASQELETFTTLVHQEGLIPFLNGKGPFTVFAPSNDAFAALNSETLAALAAKEGALAQVLKYHVVHGQLSAAALAQHTHLVTLTGEMLMIEAVDGTIRINGSLVTHADRAASNGIVHGIEDVLMPGTSTVTPPTTTSENTIVDIASSNSDLSTLVQAIQVAGLVDALSTDGPFTVFAPTNAAFAALPAGVLNDLLAQPDALAEVLQFHVINDALQANDVTAATTLPTLQGTSVAVGVFGDNVFINDALIQVVDIQASNGVIHVIDAVLTPPEKDNILEIAAEAGGFETLLTAINAAGLTSTLSSAGPFTVFAPTDDAFAALPSNVLADLLQDPQALANILTYHVAAGSLNSGDIVTMDTITTLQGEDVDITVFGSSLMIHDAMVTMTNIQASNGVIHVIDTVLIPPPPPTIVDVALEAGTFSTLLAAVDAAGLTDTLSDPSQHLTVFAPTDAAFAALPEGTLEALLADTDALTKLLLYHVADGALTSEQIDASLLVPTLNGNDVSVTMQDGDITINDALVVIVDIEAANGVIHVIDTVLTQPHTIAATLVSQPATFSTLTTAVSVAGLFQTLNGDTAFTVFAPTNDAFAKLPNGVLEGLLANPAALQDVITYHVVAGKVSAAQVAATTILETVQGQDIDVSLENGMVFVDNTTFSITNLPCTNGVIHVIDAVLTPAM
jgi:uncharacterized surface protein with fasciclin (FAS1) repeats